MSEDHREFAERMFSAINHRDLDAFLAGVTEDVEFRSLIAEAEGQTFRGHDGVREWWTQVAQSLGGLGFELEDYRQEGDCAVIRVRVRGTIGTTGVEQRMWQATILRDGRTTWWELFRTEEEAWSAARARLEAGVDDHRGE